MCDEAGGCDHSVGNFRGVCPINGRQQIRTQSVMTTLPFVSSSGNKCGGKGGNLRIREQGLKTRASGTAGSLTGTPECGNMMTLKSCPKPFPRRLVFGFLIRDGRETPGCVFKIYCAAFKKFLRFINSTHTKDKNFKGGRKNGNTGKNQNQT